MTRPLHVSPPVYGGRGEYVLFCAGALDGFSYRALRDIVVKAALDEPDVVIVDVNDLDVPDASAWSVFTSARWHVSTWPDVPILLVCANEGIRTLLHRRGISRYVPVFPTAQDAVQFLGTTFASRRRQRARAELPPHVSSIVEAQRLVDSWLRSWDRADSIPVAAIIATAFVENVLRHTDSAPILRVEYDSHLIAVAVEDTNRALAQRKEDRAFGTSRASGLEIVTALSRRWGNLPTPSGKTVWALLGPENSL